MSDQSDQSDQPIRVLLLEDNPGDARLIQEVFGSAELAGAASPCFSLQHADRLAGGLEHLAGGEVDVILLDLSLPDSQGLDTFKRVHAQASQVPIIVLSGIDNEALATQAVREGAQDYLVKGQVDSHLLVRAVRYAIERKRVEEALQWEAGVNAAIAGLSRALISAIPLEDISSLVLDEAKRLTGSAFGFAGYIDPQTGYLVSPTLSRDIWDYCRIADKAVVFEQFRGLWGWVLKNRRPLLTNAPEHDPRSSGVPAGHVPIRRFLSAPALINEELAGQIALANPLRDYTERDLALIERLANLYAVAVQRKFAQDALRESEERYRGLVQNVPVGIFRSTPGPRGEFLMANPAFLAMFGLSSKAELMRVEAASLYVSPADRALFSDTLLSDGSVIGMELRLKRIDGTPIWGSVTATVVYDEHGQAAYFDATIQDITERKHAEEALREAERKLDRMLQTMVDGMITVDTGGEITYANPAAHRILGSEPGQIVSRNYDEQAWRQVDAHGRPYPPDQLPLAVALREVRDVEGLEHGIVDQEGETRWLSVNAVPLVDENGHLYGAAASFRDVTEDRRASEALVRYAQEQATLYAISSTVATSLDPDELLWTVLDMVLPLLNSDAGWIVLPGPTLDDPPHVVAWRGVTEAFLAAEASLPLRTCPVCAPLLEGQQLPGEPAVLSGCPRLPPDVLRQSSLYSHIGIPLIAGGRALGILNVAWRTPHVYPPGEHALLLTIGRQVGMALHNAQLYQAARQVDRLQAINALDQALSATLDPRRVAEVTLQQIAVALDAPVGVLFLAPAAPQVDTGQTYVLGRGWVDMIRTEEHRERFQTLWQWVQDGHEIKDLSDEMLSEASTRPHMAQRWGLHGIAVPIMSEGETIAVLALGGRPADRPFNNEDRALARAAAARTGQAIRNAWLYRASQDQSARLATLNAISTAAVTSLDVDVVLQRILQLTCRALDAEEGSILSRDAGSGDLTFMLTLADATRGLQGLRLARGQGIAGWVAEHDQGIYANEVGQDERWYSGVDERIGFTTRSVLCAPLRRHGQVTGVIEIVNRREGRFVDEDLNLLDSVASITAVAIENARLFSTTRARAEELALLHEIGLALTSTLDYTAVVQAALSQVQQLFRAENVSLLRADPQTGELRFVQAMAGAEPIDIPLSLHTGEGIAGWALEHRQPVLVADAQQDPRFWNRVDRYLGGETRALMAVPLLMHERVVGVIEVISNRPGVYTDEELRTLQALASTLAVALENARLYDELKTLLHEREQAQAQLIQAEKMTALGRLIASIAHEINNPLQSVQGCLTLAEEGLTDGSSVDEMKSYLDIAADEIERISAIVRRMRDFYRPARRETQPTQVQSVLESVLELTGKQLQHNAVNVRCEWSPNLPMVHANPDHLKQVFLNLVLNAVDAMPRGGTLHVQTTPGEIQIDRNPAPAVCVAFRDTGVGMPPHVLSRLFEPFFTTKEHGSGLGLSISYGIIKAHNGEIAIDSEVGVGTIVTIRLPVDGA